MIYQVKISLRGSKPIIWRRILIPSDLLLPEFHQVIQTTMGWSNFHLHQFIKNRTYYTPKFEEEDFFGDSTDYEDIKVSDLLKREKEKIIYEYDFGDDWQHDVLLEKILPDDPQMKLPVCIKGKMNCPPEDCGGVWGYENMLEILSQPDHEEYEDYMDWLGGEFDPGYFDMDEINESLRKEDYGCPVF